MVESKFSDVSQFFVGGSIAFKNDFQHLTLQVCFIPSYNHFTFSEKKVRYFFFKFNFPDLHR